MESLAMVTNKAIFKIHRRSAAVLSKQSLSSGCQNQGCESIPRIVGQNITTLVMINSHTAK